jgi:hypothetical protein
MEYNGYMPKSDLVLLMKSSNPNKKLQVVKQNTDCLLVSRLLVSRLLVSLLMIVILLTNPASAIVVSGNNHLELEVSSISPNPAKPGEDLLIKVNAENTGDEPAKNVIIGIEEVSPFIFKYSTSGIYGSGTNTERFFQIDQIQPHSMVELNFHFKVDPNTESGDYQLKFTIKDNSGTIFSKIIPIHVEGNPDLVLTDTQILPVNENNSFSEAIVPGREFYLRTVIKNVGTGKAKNIRVMINLNNSSPLVPLEDNVRFVENLSTGDSENLSFKLLLGSNANVQPYTIPLWITASNDTETFQIEKAQEIGINVFNRAKIDISSLKFDPGILVKGQQVSMILRLENIGEGEARAVKAKLEGLEGSGSTSAFLGRLDKGDDAPAVFTFVPERAGNQIVTLSVEYEDDLGEHQLREPLNFNVLGNNSIIPSEVPFFILIIPILIIGFMIRKRKVCLNWKNCSQGKVCPWERMGFVASYLKKKKGKITEEKSEAKTERGV